MAQTAKAQQNAAMKDPVLKEKPSNITEITLEDGRIAKCIRAKGHHVMSAQRLMGDASEKMIPALISVCTSIDGKQPTMEEVLDYDAADYLTLMGHYSKAFPSSQEK